MIFSKPSVAVAASILFIAACGGSESPSNDASENTVENSTVTPASSPITAPDAGPAAEFAALPAPYNGANYARGRRTFKLCQSCHTVTADGQNLVGPKLYGVFGRQIGSVEGFSYSNAVSDADFIWTPELLDEWLTSPRNFLPGNKMSFSGVRKPEDRLAVIAYLMAETTKTED